MIEFYIVHATQMICREIHKLFMIETSFYWKTFSVLECFILTDSNEIELINLYVDRIGVLISFIFADSELQDLSFRGGSWDLRPCPRC